MIHRRLRVANGDSCFYSTPTAVTEALLDYWSPPAGASIWEPACGAGAISEVLIEKGYKVTSTDINYRGYGHLGDFLEPGAKAADYIITNPPFFLLDLFIQRAIELKLKGFAFLTPANYWHRAGHAETFTDYRPKFVLPLSFSTRFSIKERKVDLDVSWLIWQGESKTTVFDLLKRKPLERKPKAKAKSGALEKVTLNLCKGDKDILAGIFREDGWGVGVRKLLRNFCEENENDD